MLIGVADRKSVNVMTALENYPEIIEFSISKFWKLEELPTFNKLTEKEQKCEDYFKHTPKRDESRRFLVKIPWNDGSRDLTGSLRAATVRLTSVERRLKSHPKRQMMYTEFMEEYQMLGHMVECQNVQNSDQNICYLPHHYVIKESSSTTKLRVVFDAACKNESGNSLNDYMMTGPKLQDDLFVILIRFRRHNVAITADIEKMYRQIRVHKDDQDLQRIVWRSNCGEQLKYYKLLTVTYGTASAPYLAMKCLKQLAQDEKDHYPVGSRIADQDFYVDDLMSGGDTEEEGIIIQQEIQQLCLRGGFKLRKWSSNSQKILDKLNQTWKFNKMRR